MNKPRQASESSQTIEKTDSEPLRIAPMHSVDRLARVKEWIRLGRAPMSNVQRYRFPEKVAAIIAKTYAECGDGAVLSDDIALMRIKDLLLELDEGIIRRNTRSGRMIKRND
jgi:hypothetical protein